MPALRCSATPTQWITLHYAKVDRHVIDDGHGGDMTKVERFVAGPRRFDVVVEGDVLREDYDPLHDAGYATADVFSVEKEVTDGLLEIRFHPRVGDPRISAIDVERIDRAQ